MFQNCIYLLTNKSKSLKIYSNMFIKIYKDCFGPLDLVLKVYKNTKVTL